MRLTHRIALLGLLTLPAFALADATLSEHEQNQQMKEQMRNDAARLDEHYKPNTPSSPSRPATPDWKALEEADAAANNAEWRARQEYYDERVRQIHWQAEQQRLADERRKVREAAEAAERARQQVEGQQRYELDLARARQGDVQSALRAAEWMAYFPEERDPLLMLAGDYGRREAWITGALLSRRRSADFLSRLRLDRRDHGLAYAESAVIALDHDKRLPAAALDLRDRIVILTADPPYEPWFIEKPLWMATLYAAFIAEPSPVGIAAAVNYQRAAMEDRENTGVGALLYAASRSRGSRLAKEPALTPALEIELWRKACSGTKGAIAQLACVKAAFLAGETGPTLRLSLAKAAKLAAKDQASDWLERFSRERYSSQRRGVLIQDYVDATPLELLRLESLARIAIAAARNPALPAETRALAASLAAESWSAVAWQRRGLGDEDEAFHLASFLRARVQLLQALETGELDAMKWEKDAAKKLLVSQLLVLRADLWGSDPRWTDQWLRVRAADYMTREKLELHESKLGARLLREAAGTSGR